MLASSTCFNNMLLAQSSPPAPTFTSTAPNGVACGTSMQRLHNCTRKFGLVLRIWPSPLRVLAAVLVSTHALAKAVKLDISVPRKATGNPSLVVTTLRRTASS